MGYVVEIPKLGPEMESGTVTTWLVEEGEPVEADGVIAEIESEGTTGEVQARENGVLRRRLLEEGESAEPGAAMGIVAGADADVSDLEASLEGEGTDAAVVAEEDVEERPLDGMRRTIASRLGQSYREAVHVTEQRTADAEALRAAAKAAAAVHDESITVTDVLLAAISAALEAHPAFNATFEDDVHRLHDEHNLCVAVDVEDGLIAPVIRGVGDLEIDDLARERATMTERALSGEYTMDDLTGGTFTVSNLGLLGVESFDPVINPPQIAILGVNALDERPVARNGEVVVRRTLPLSLSFDHRLVDGADAARFLETLVGHLEEPWPLLEGVTPADVPSDVRWRDGGAAETVTELPERDVTAHVRPDLSGSVAAGSTEWPFDVTPEWGGGRAPTPVDYFLGALSACLADSIAIQADVRDVAFDGIDVRVVGAPADGNESVEEITVDVRLDVDADVDDDALERIVAGGERTCHVAELLREDLEVDIDWSRT